MTPNHIDRYEVRGEIGRGGMATVLKGYDPRFKRDVAIKLLPREFLHDPQFRARFQREAQTIAALEHPAIVPVYDFGDANGQLYLVMRLMTGGSLAERLEKGPLSIIETARIFDRLAPALDSAHALGIIHRDLKPANILFDQWNNPYLSDFGIAKLVAGSSTALTATGGLVGTPAYMSPEQVRGVDELDGRSDIYAMGVILFQMLTGKLPYNANTPIGLAFLHVTEPVPNILEANSSLPYTYQAVINKAMAKERDARPRTTTALAATISFLVLEQDNSHIILDLDTKETIVDPIPDQERAKELDIEVLETPAASRLPLTALEAEQYQEKWEPKIPDSGSQVGKLPQPIIYQDELMTRRFPTWGWAVLGILVLALLAGGLWRIFDRGKEDLGIVPTVVFTAVDSTIVPTFDFTTAVIVQNTATVVSTAVATPVPSTPTLLPTILPTATLDPIEIAWLSSAHADAEAEPFIHWNGDDPAEIPISCAKCHSTSGFLDYIGEDGSEANLIDMPAPIGTVITCEACHNTVAETMSEVIMPSGITLDDLGQEAVCIQCHQGRSSTVAVDERIGSLGNDEIDDALLFVNIHYYSAAASLFGGEAMGAYQYPQSQYVGRYEHVGAYDTCIECHNVHTLIVRAADCVECHEGSDTLGELDNIRVYEDDWDGDGNTTEGAAREIDTMRNILLEALQDYANNQIGVPIAYNVTTYPYFFIDANGDGVSTGDEINSANRYTNWTPRLLRAAYNYQFSMKDPGLFSHNPTYGIQILYDSIEDIEGDTSNMIRP